MKATIVGLAVFASNVLALFSQNFNPTGQGCVDPQGFLSCYQKQIDQVPACASLCNGANAAGSTGLQTCLVGCNGAQLAGNVGCWIQSCWNQLYSCEHQATVINYFSGNNIIQNADLFEWYPPPLDATEGTCSCNLGYAYGNRTILQATPGYNTPCMNVALKGIQAETNACQCCEFAFLISNILNICPTSNLAFIGFPDYVTLVQNLLSPSVDDCAILDTGVQDTCLNTYGYRFRGTHVFNPLNLPSGIPGKDPLTNKPGNAFTVFGASVYTLAIFPGYTSTITPAAFVAGAGVATGTISGSVLITDSGVTASATSVATSATGTVKTTSMSAGTSTAAAAATTSKSAAGSYSANTLLACGAAIAAIGGSIF